MYWVNGQKMMLGPQQVENMDPGTKGFTEN